MNNITDQIDSSLTDAVSDLHLLIMRSSDKIEYQYRLQLSQGDFPNWLIEKIKSIEKAKLALELLEKASSLVSETYNLS